LSILKVIKGKRCFILGPRHGFISSNRRYEVHANSASVKICCSHKLHWRNVRLIILNKNLVELKKCVVIIPPSSSLLMDYMYLKWCALDPAILKDKALFHCMSCSHLSESKFLFRIFHPFILSRLFMLSVLFLSMGKGTWTLTTNCQE